jgi:hypothetical protein
MYQPQKTLACVWAHVGGAFDAFFFSQLWVVRRPQRLCFVWVKKDV